MSNSITLPNILVNKVSDETQEISMISDVLEPNQSSQTSCRFVLQPKGTILDSLSSFCWRTEWSDYNPSAKTTEAVVFKDFNGSLNTIKRCRMYVGQKIIMQQEHSNIKMFMDNRFEESDRMCEIHDCRFGAMNDFQVSMTADNSIDVDVGQVELGRDAPSSFSTTNRRFTRLIGSDKLGWDSQVFLSELFTGLKDLSLPVSKMKEQISIEIDFETNFDKVFYDATSTASTRIPANRRNVKISNPRILADYIQYDIATDSALTAQVESSEGIIVPFRETIVIERTLNATTSSTAVSQDIPFQLNGKSLMKIMVQKLVNTGATKVLGVGKSTFQGDSRSDALPNEKFNLLINDLLIYDQPVSSSTEKYAQLSQVGEKPYYAFPEGMEFKALSSAYSDDDILTNRKIVAGREINKATFTSADAEIGTSVSSGLAGSLSFLGTSLGLYGKNSGDTLASAAYRIGASPVILRYERSGGAASTFEGQAVKIKAFIDVLRVMDLNSGFTSVRDQ